MSRVLLAEFKEYLRVANSGSDTVLQECLDAASVWIDNTCGAPERQFAQDVGVSARTIPVHGRQLVRGTREVLVVPDISTSVGLLVDGVAGVAVTPPPGRPITELYTGAWYDDDVVVAARWGWPSVPEPVLRAELLLGSRLWKRRDAPEGVLGNDQWGLIRVGRVDPDVMALLDPYVLPGFA